MDDSPFSKLSPEIRNLIWEYAVTEKLIPLGLPSQPCGQASSILRTCRQINREAKGLYYSCNTFTRSDLTIFDAAFLKQWVDAIGPDSCKALRKLALNPQHGTEGSMMGRSYFIEMRRFEVHGHWLRMNLDDDGWVEVFKLAKQCGLFPQIEMKFYHEDSYEEALREEERESRDRSLSGAFFSAQHIWYLLVKGQYFEGTVDDVSVMFQELLEASGDLVHLLRGTSRRDGDSEDEDDDDDGSEDGSDVERDVFAE